MSHAATVQPIRMQLDPTRPPQADKPIAPATPEDHEPSGLPTPVSLGRAFPFETTSPRTALVDAHAQPGQGLVWTASAREGGAGGCRDQGTGGEPHGPTPAMSAFSTEHAIHRPFRARYDVSRDSDAEDGREHRGPELDLEDRTATPESIAYKRSFEEVCSSPPLDIELQTTSQHRAESSPAASMRSLRSMRSQGSHARPGSYEAQRVLVGSGRSRFLQHDSEMGEVRQDGQDERGKRRRPSPTRLMPEDVEMASQLPTPTSSLFLPFVAASGSQHPTRRSRLSLPSLSSASAPRSGELDFATPAAPVEPPAEDHALWLSSLRPSPPAALDPAQDSRHGSSFLSSFRALRRPSVLGSHQLAPPTVFGASVQGSSPPVSTSSSATGLATLQGGTGMRPRAAIVTPDVSREREMSRRARNSTGLAMEGDTVEGRSPLLRRIDALIQSGEDHLRNGRPSLDALPSVPRGEPSPPSEFMPETGAREFPSLRNLADPQRPNETPPIIGIRVAAPQVAERWRGRANVTVQPSPPVLSFWDEAVETIEAQNLDRRIRERRDARRGWSEDSLDPERELVGDSIGRPRAPELEHWGDIHESGSHRARRMRGPTERANELLRMGIPPLVSSTTSLAAQRASAAAVGTSSRSLWESSSGRLIDFSALNSGGDGPSVWRTTTPPPSTTRMEAGPSHDGSGAGETSPFARAASPSPTSESRRRPPSGVRWLGPEEQRADPTSLFTPGTLERLDLPAWGSSSRPDLESLSSAESSAAGEGGLPDGPQAREPGLSSRARRFPRPTPTATTSGFEFTRYTLPPPSLANPALIRPLQYAPPSEATVGEPRDETRAARRRSSLADALAHFATRSDSPSNGRTELRRRSASRHAAAAEALPSGQSERLVPRDEGAHRVTERFIEPSHLMAMRRDRAAIRALLDDASEEDDAAPPEGRVGGRSPGAAWRASRRGFGDFLRGFGTFDRAGGAGTLTFEDDSPMLDARNYLDDATFDSSYEALLRLSERLGDVPRSARTTSAKLSSLKTFQYQDWSTSMASGSARDARCGICLGDYEEEDYLRLGECDHAFHRDCLDPWLKERGSCPLCRKVVQ